MTARISETDAARLGIRAPKTAVTKAARPSKYGAQRAAASDGRQFASKAERDRYEALLLEQRAGLISDLRCQVIYHFPIDGELLTVNGRKTRYTADFAYRDARTGQEVIEDTKGFLTNDAALRIGLMRAVHGIEVRLTGAGGQRRPRKRA